jgi:hypothetical protein
MFALVHIGLGNGDAFIQVVMLNNRVSSGFAVDTIKEATSAFLLAGFDEPSTRTMCGHVSAGEQ